MFTIEKEFSFEASHHLPQMPDGHKCKRPHGHSYRVIVELQAEQLNESTGFVRDFGDLSEIKEWIDENFDHEDLAQVLGGGEYTTAEMLARIIFNRWKKSFPELSAVTVCETAKTRATYRPHADIAELAKDLIAHWKKESLAVYGHSHLGIMRDPRKGL
jgi:6-pyruvoyltetrahydropterin/6-carboxytetrahydropterin synthase